jgi:hypothetical protein
VGRSNSQVYLSNGCGDQLDRVGLTVSAGLMESLAGMGPDRGLGDPERLSNFGNAADFDDGEQNRRCGPVRDIGPREDSTGNEPTPLRLLNSWSCARPVRRSFRPWHVGSLGTKPLFFLNSRFTSTRGGRFYFLLDMSGAQRKLGEGGLAFSIH